MNIRNVILGIAFTLLIGNNANATIIGPDSYGYSATDQVGYNFIDIRGTGTNPFPAYSDDSTQGPINIGFNFNFYGTPYSSVYFSTNGFLTLTSPGSADFSNESLITNTNRPEPIIAPYWDDLVVDDDDPIGGGVYYETIGSPGSRQFISEWYVRRIAQFGTDLLFEVILFEGSNNILFQYADVVGTNNSNGLSATVGIRDANGQNTGNVLQWSYNQAVISDDQAILFTTQPIPEPATMILLGTGLIGVAGAARRKKKNQA